MKRFSILSILSALLFAGTALAQTKTTVTGTVKEANGLPYASGTVLPQLVNVSGGATPTVTATGAPYVPPNTPTVIGSDGTLSVSVADVTTLSPGGILWQFRICSAPQISPIPGLYLAQCFTTIPISISGSTQNITSTINAVPPPVLVPGSAIWALATGGTGLSQVVNQTVLTRGSGIAPFAYQAQIPLTISGLTSTSACTATPPNPMPPSWAGMDWFVAVSANTAVLYLNNSSPNLVTPVGVAMNIKCIL